MRPASFPASYRLSFAVLVGCLLATAAVSWQLSREIASTDRERFDNAVDRLQDAITERIAMYVAMLRAGAAVIDSRRAFDADQFRTFVDRLDLQQRYPGIQGVGVTLRLTRDEVTALEAERRAHGDPAFRVWPEPPREEYHSIVLLEPMDRRNRAAIGYDMFTEPIRREAMERARDTGQPAASGPLILVQEIDQEKQYGFLIYMPVYEGGGLPATVEERRERLMGFVYSPFRMGDLFAGIFGRDLRPRAGFDIIDAAQPDLVLHRTGERGAGTDTTFAATRGIMVAGRPWIASFFPMPSLFDSSNARLVPLMFGAGVGFSLLIAGLVAGQTRARLRLERSERDLQRASQIAREQAIENAELYRQLQDLLSSERAARGEAERVSHMKDEFLAMLSHELRTPLNAIYGWAHLLTSAPLTEEKRRLALATILRNAKIQLQLVEDLLDMSRIVSGREYLETADLLLADLIEAAVGVVRPDAEAKGVAIRVELPPRQRPVRGDAKRLQQVFWNLLTNAIKFTPSGGSVHIALAYAGDSAMVTVRDTGVGIPPEFLTSVFDRFRQVDGSTARHHGGLGLGLSIVKSLVQMHGGTVTAASDGVNRGSTFTVTLPLTDVPEVEKRPREPKTAPHSPLAADALAGATILVVDDQDDARELVRNVLANYGATVRLAPSALAALAVLDTAPVDLVVSDISMPAVDGYELIRRIRQRSDGGGSVRAIALTAYASGPDRARALAAGYDDHVSKPVVPHELVAACATLLQTTARAAHR